MAALYQRKQRESLPPEEVRKAVKMFTELEPKYGKAAEQSKKNLPGQPALQIFKNIGTANRYLFANLAPESGLVQWLKKTDKQLAAERGNIVPTSEVSGADLALIELHYAPFLISQKEYLSQIDFMNIQADDVLDFTRQLMACIDLHLRLTINQKIGYPSIR